MKRKFQALALFTILFSQQLIAQNDLINTSQNLNSFQSNIFPNCVFYQIFIRSYYDSNGDGIGDINGITQKLDYLQGLGVHGLWITPVNPSPSYHKYDVTDYYDIDKEYGTLDDFKLLINEAHNRNIKVVMDMVINHCSSNHPWFVKAMADTNSEYRNYFVWKKATAVSSEKNHWYVIRNNKPANLITTKTFDKNEYAYYGFFSSDMPDFNYDNPKVREEMIKSGKFWLQEIGVDGYRLDAAKWIYPEQEADKSQAWWREYTAALRTVKPDAFFVGEITDNFKHTAPYLKDALTSVFNFDLGYALIPSLNTEKDTGIAVLIKNSRDYFINASPTFVDATFLTNHDQNRIGSQLKGNIIKMKLAANILLTLPGSPFIYYGEEIGMLGPKPDENIREPFLWDQISNDNGRCKWINAKFTTDQTVTPLALQVNDATSIYNHYHALIKLRNSNDALTHGEIAPVDFANKGVIAYRRIYNEDDLLVVHNITSNIIKVQIDALQKKYFATYYSSNDNNLLTGTTIMLQPYASIILK